MSYSLPSRNLTGVAKRQYNASYRDGYHLYPYGSGEESPNEQYRCGFYRGRADINTLSEEYA